MCQFHNNGIEINGVTINQSPIELGLIYQSFDAKIFNQLRPCDAYMRQYNIPTLLQMMACRLFGAKPLSESLLPYCQRDRKEHISVKICLEFKSFHSWKYTLKCRLWNGGNLPRPRCGKIPYGWSQELGKRLRRIHIPSQISKVFK